MPLNRPLLIVTIALSFATQPSHGSGYDPIVQPGARAWLNGAQTGRADMLVLGDSTVTQFFGGMTHAVHGAVGLAGGGLMTSFWDVNSGHSIHYPGGIGSFNWNAATTAIAPDKRQYAWSQGVPSTAGSTPASGYGFYLGGAGYFDSAAAWDWHLYTSGSAPSNGPMYAARVLNEHPYATYEVVTNIATISEGPGLKHSVVHFAPMEGLPGDMYTGGVLNNVTNTTIHYSRLLKPGTPKGATVSGWVYGGKPTLDFLTDKYLSGPSTPTGRQQLLSALTDGGSGKLMVVIFEGLNDRGYQNRPSYSGILPGNTPAAYVDNMANLINNVRADWIGAGRNPDDLSFLTIGNYEIEADRFSALGRGYAYAMREYAANHPDVSFVDLWNLSPTYLQSRELGYVADSVHASFEGTKLMSEGMLKTLMNNWRAGDATLDGIVNYKDFEVLYRNFGKPGHRIQGDFNGDDFVNFADFQILENALYTAGPISAASAEQLAHMRGALEQQVPEPASGLSCIAVIALLAKRRAK